MPRVNFLFALIILLTACTPNATPAPLPTVTLSPVVSIAPTIAATEIPSIANPISPESMTMLGFTWDSVAGTLLNVDGKVLLTLTGDSFVDKTGLETLVKDVRVIPVNGVDDKGVHIGSVLLGISEDDGQINTTILNTKTGQLEWAPPEPGSITENMVISELPEVWPMQIDDGTLRLWLLTKGHEWPANTFDPNFHLVGRDLLPLPYIYLTMFGSEDPNRDANLRASTTPFKSYFYKLGGTDIPIEGTLIYGGGEGDMVFTTIFPDSWSTNRTAASGQLQFELFRGGGAQIDWLVWAAEDNNFPWVQPYGFDISQNVLDFVGDYDYVTRLLPPGFVERLYADERNFHVEKLDTKALAEYQDKFMIPLYAQNPGHYND